MVKPQAFFDRLTQWTSDNARHYTYLEFPVKVDGMEHLPVHGSYFQVTVSQAFLGKSRKWFNEYYPAAHTTVRIQHANYEPLELSHVSQVPGDNLAKGIDLNHTVTGRVPWNGGTLEIDCGLVALKGPNFLEGPVKVLSSFSELVAAPVSQAITIATKVATSLNELMTDHEGQVHLNFHQTFTDEAGGNPLCAGYYAAILATKEQLQGKKFKVDKDQLLADGQPFVGFDYILFRIDGITNRPDWKMKSIDSATEKARSAYLSGNNAEGDKYRAAALVAVFETPELSDVDKVRVSKMIRADLDPLKDTGAGALEVLAAPKSLDELMHQPGVMSWEAAYALGVPSAEDILGD